MKNVLISAFATIPVVWILIMYCVAGWALASWQDPGDILWGYLFGSDHLSAVILRFMLYVATSVVFIIMLNLDPKPTKKNPYAEAD